MKEGLTRNGWIFKKESIQKYGSGFKGQPILISYKGGRIGDSHNCDISYDFDTGEVFHDYTAADAERIVGEIIDTHIKNGWLCFSARIWKLYAYQLCKKIVSGKKIAVSVEVLIDEASVEADGNGAEIYHKWLALGVTLLGDGAQPAIPGAGITKVAYNSFDEAFKSMEHKAAEWDNKKGGYKKMTFDKCGDGSFVLSQSADENGVIKQFILRDGAIMFRSGEEGEIHAAEVVEAEGKAELRAQEEKCEIELSKLIETCISYSEQNAEKKINALQTENETLKEEKANLQAEIDTLKNALIDERATVVEHELTKLHSDTNKCVSQEDFDKLVERKREFAGMAREGKYIGIEEATKEFAVFAMNARRKEIDTKSNNVDWLKELAPGIPSKENSGISTLVKNLENYNND